MLDVALRHAPLAGHDTDLSLPGLELSERPFTAKINLRGRAEDAAFLEAAKRALDAPLPLQPNRVETTGEVSILWLGPDEWLVAGAAGSETKILEALDQVLEGFAVSITDVSDAMTVIELSGAHARAVLRKGCGIDLHPRAFATGHCAQTALALAQVIFHQTGEAPGFDLYVDRSFADYLWRWLLDATLEYRAGG